MLTLRFCPIHKSSGIPLSDWTPARIKTVDNSPNQIRFKKPFKVRVDPFLVIFQRILRLDRPTWTSSFSLMPGYQSECRLLGLPDDRDFLGDIRRGSLIFKNIEDEQCSKINSISRSEVFEFIKAITKRSLFQCVVAFYYCSRYPIYWLTDPEEIANTVKAILMCVQSRLQGMTSTVKRRSGTRF